MEGELQSYTSSPTGVLTCAICQPNDADASVAIALPPYLQLLSFGAFHSCPKGISVSHAPEPDAITEPGKY
jgi:hypothetical protein